MSSPVPHDLFSPGRGAAPPFLAGREEELRKLDKKIPKPGGKPPARDIVLIGPRGNGKTALLEEFSRRCSKAGADVLETTPDAMEDKAVLVAWLLAPAGPRETSEENEAKRLLSRLPPALRAIMETIRDWVPKVKNLGIPGVIGLEFDRMDASRQKQTLLHLDSLLLEACRERPRVALLDEAHTLDPKLARTLLNAAQKVNKKGGNFLLVLAGTPQLAARLRKANDSFWSRCMRIGIGRLSEDATREALEKPLAEYGVSFEPEALAAVVEESQCYPYFIQLWGEALCEALPEGSRTISLLTVAEALRSFDSEKTSYYEDRYEELGVRDLLPAASAAAAAFAECGGKPMLDETFEAEMAQRTGATKAQATQATRELERLGFIWKPPGGTRHEPGIPSLMNHVLGRRAHPAPATDAEIVLAP